jgi:capsular polysaccharide transport system ATP-binding protein
MSIELHDVTKGVLLNRKRRPLFKHLDFWMEDGERVAVLGPKGSGKSMILAIICGAEPVDEGWVSCTSRVSWPIPQSSFFTNTTPVITNIRFVARLYGVDRDRFVREIAELAGIEAHLNERLGQCPRFVRAQLAFALSMWFDFDIYLFDERVMTTPKPFRARAMQIMQARLRGKGLLLTTSSTKLAMEYCETAFVIDGGRAEHYTDMKAAVKHYDSLDKNLGVETEEEEVEEEDDETDM